MDYLYLWHDRPCLVIEQMRQPDFLGNPIAVVKLLFEGGETAIVEVSDFYRSAVRISDGKPILSRRNDEH